MIRIRMPVLELFPLSPDLPGRCLRPQSVPGREISRQSFLEKFCLQARFFCLIPPHPLSKSTNYSIIILEYDNILIDADDKRRSLTKSGNIQNPRILGADTNSLRTKKRGVQSKSNPREPGPKPVGHFSASQEHENVGDRGMPEKRQPAVLPGKQSPGKKDHKHDNARAYLTRQRLKTKGGRHGVSISRRVCIF